ncbi:hypothetical protein C8J57DRAFT_1578371 [Mycena rebaudengoi]|nr:hypothetical protein C8J57DRAFT_1578371 [Mycena rebaudengoi]
MTGFQFLIRAEITTISQGEKLHAGSALAWHYSTTKLSVLASVPKACITDFTPFTVTALLCELRKSERISAELINIKAAKSYWEETTAESFYNLPGTAWIRLSTGKLCVVVGEDYESCANITDRITFGPVELPEVKLTENDLGAKLLCTLELNEFYSMLAQYNTDLCEISSSTPGTITLPSICNAAYDDHSQFQPNAYCAIPTTTNFTLNDLSIGSWDGSDLPLEVLPTGWTRIEYPECDSYRFWLRIGLNSEDIDDTKKWWLSQNHYVHKRCNVPSVDPLEQLSSASFTSTAS